MKKALFVIAPIDFRDEELFVPKEILEKAEIKTEIASSNAQPSKGMLGKIAKPDLALHEVNVDEYDAIIFVGGTGAAQYLDDKRALDLAKQFYEKNKIVAAICIAPSILANAGIANGKKLTAYPSQRNNINAVAIYTGALVEKDGNIITANGPEAASEFGHKLVEVLK